LVPEIGQKLEVHEMDRDLILAALGDLRARRSGQGAAIISGAPST
jgi:hypothetical protein